LKAAIVQLVVAMVKYGIEVEVVESLQDLQEYKHDSNS
jgi:hypothetical protein